MSTQVNLSIIALFFVSCTFFSVLIPPFQSPDEIAHINRAYLLSKGEILLKSAFNHPIDSGLGAYMSSYYSLTRSPKKRLSSHEIRSAKHITWTGVEERNGVASASYFPLIYMPQAIGLAIGEKSGLTIDVSYRLARLLALLSIAFLLFVSFNIYPTNPFVVGMLILPMSIFQFASASLDGISTALSVFSIAAFMRISNDKEKASSWLFYTLTIGITLL